MYDDLTHNLQEVAQAVGVSARTVQRLVGRGQFPKPIKLGSRIVWRRADIELFIKAGSIHAFRRAKRGD